ncbi:phycobilisome protein [Merismopedia glauca]|uniref:Phycobilisome protein n=1 Tax=Merismopedia glauca CCAP 1448/3 TaxID=1296344 RepID=A0A2T1BXJ2_9CYAN|nr:phycobilisome protein [Merismopedia glauca]PSB00736.1 phycobilisome protein [Merismopedia glauca CCAP 1448/3]
MHPQLTTLLHEAEYRYLELEDLQKFQTHTVRLSHALAIYNLIQKNEIEIFQNIANLLIKEFKQTEESTIELALCNWLTVLRYCAMAMVLNNRDFLNLRLLEWMKDLVRVRPATVIESRLYEVLIEQLSKVLSAAQMMELNPFLEMAFLEIANNTFFSNGEIANQEQLN